MSKNIDDVNRKIRADSERARSMGQLCEEGTFSGPFRKKPTLTDSEVKKMVGNYEVDDFAAGFAAGFRHAGGEIIPDPEPTNSEKLEKIIWASDGPVASIRPTRAELLGKWLDEHGVTAPGGDDE